MKNSKYRIILLILSMLFIATIFSGCNNKNGKNKNNENDAAQGKIMFSNLAENAVQDKLSEIMTSADISEERQQVFFDHVNQFNAIVSPESLVADFAELKEGEIKYDPYEMQDQWNEKSPEFMGYNCRITAFGLFRDFLDISSESEKREDMIMIDRVSLEEDSSVLLDKNDENAFAVLYSTVPTTLTKDIETHVKNLQKDWENREIKFKENEKASLISVVFHESFDENNNYLFIGHTGVLFDYNGKVYFVEKIAFQEPYQMTEFNNREELYDYLMKKYDISFDQPTASPFIMENDQLLKK